MKVHFYCKESRVNKDGKAPVEITIIEKGRAVIQSPIRCKPKDFTKMMKGSSPDKTYLMDMQSKIEKIYYSLLLDEKPFNAETIKRILISGGQSKLYTLDDLFNDGLNQKMMDDPKPYTYNRYSNIIAEFYAHTGHKPTDDADSVKYNDIVLFAQKIDKENASSTAANKKKHLKYFFTLAFKSGKIKQHPFLDYKIGRGENKDTTYLTYEELNKIRALRLTSNRLEKVRDLFVFQAFTGLSYVDLTHLEPDDVKKNEQGQLYIKKPRHKTGVEYTAILFEDAAMIWEEYNGILPIMSDVKYNLYIKELAKMAGIDKHLTTHTARHTAAVYCLNTLKLELPVVQKILGHAKISQTQHYAKLLDTSVFNATSQKDKTKTPSVKTKGGLLRVLLDGTV